MFFRKFCKVFHKSVFTEHFWATASDLQQRFGNISQGVQDSQKINKVDNQKIIKRQKGI